MTGALPPQPAPNKQTKGSDVFRANRTFCFIYLDGTLWTLLSAVILVYLGAHEVLGTEPFGSFDYLCLKTFILLFFSLEIELPMKGLGTWGIILTILGQALCA